MRADVIFHLHEQHPSPRENGPAGTAGLNRVSFPRIFRPNFAALALASLTLVLGGCALPPSLHYEGDRVVFNASQQKKIERITAKLVALGPKTDPVEARLIAETAVRTGAELAKKYGVTMIPEFHNMLINAGMKDRGLCWQWTWDMAAALAPLKPRSFEYHWCVSDWGLRYEHNTVVVTALEQPYYDGVTLDPWIDSGRITCEKVAGDKLFKWEQRVPPAGSAFANN